MTAQVTDEPVSQPSGVDALDGLEVPTLRVVGDPDAIRTLKRMVREGGLPRVYVTDGRLVQIESVSGTPAQAGDDNAPLPVRSTQLTPAHLASLLAHHTALMRGGANGSWSEWSPPSPVLKAVLSGAEWGQLLTLAGIVGTPVVRRDGTLLQDAGYDAKTGLYLAPTVTLRRVPERPTAEQVTAARGFVLDKLLRDFEWKSPADRANYLALMVTPFIRRYLRCLSPLGILSATMPGSGKTILTALIGLLTGQRVLPWADSEEELRKVISSVFATQAGVVVFDNLAEGTSISSPTLATLLTSEVWSDRKMGGNSTVLSFDNDRLWLATGNNLRVGGDIARRSVRCDLTPKAPHPEERTGFAIPRLDGKIMEAGFRADVLWHVLVLVVDWTAAGGPVDRSLPAMGQFTGWAQGVGGFLAHHEVGGFLGNLDEARGLDEEDERWTAFLAKWLERLGSGPLRARQVFQDAAIPAYPAEPVDAWDGQFITDKHGRRPKSGDQLGIWLRGQEGRFHGDLVLRSVKDSHAGGHLWKVERHEH